MSTRWITYGTKYSPSATIPAELTNNNTWHWHLLSCNL